MHPDPSLPSRSLLRRCARALLALGLLGCGSPDSTEAQQPPSGGAGGEAGSAGKGGSKAGSSQGGAGQAGEGGAGTGGAGAGSGGSPEAGQGGAGGATTCPQLPACDAPPPDPGPKRDWEHTLSSVTSALGSPNHRGRDLFLKPGEDQWVIGKFAYGLNDKDIKEEEVDIYLLRGCGSSWEKLGTARTSNDGQNATVEGVEDTGGRVFFKIPDDKKLGLGLHRVHMVVAGDLTTTDLFLNVVEPGTPIFVSDVDGTLTTSENVEFAKLLEGTLPDAHVDAGKALTLLAQKGYIPMYVTARPEFLVQRTREFVKARGLPFGLVHTTLTLTGALAGGAVDYKTGELKMLAGKGLVPSWAFGNKDSDAEAYNNGNIQPVNHRVFYQFDDAKFGGRKINEYTDLLGEFAALPPVCKQ